MATINPAEALTQPPPASRSSLSGPATSAARPTVDTAAAAAAAGNAGPNKQKQAQGAQRVDLEPLYTSLKNAIGDRWAEYKGAVSNFAFGGINQTEFSDRVAPLLTTDPLAPHLHNRFLCGLLANATRDVPAPDPPGGVAGWVAATDKPSSGGGHGGGGAGVGGGAGGKGAGAGGLSGDDEAERRLRMEIMALPPRDRRRIKAVVAEEHHDPLIGEFMDFYAARQIKVPDTVPASAGGFNKTNWELEIRKRFTQPLFGETHEFPDTESVAARVLPICYEEGLATGVSAGCADFISLATETATKILLTSLFARTRADGRDYVRTARYKRRLEREEDAWLRGDLPKTAAGLLPVELEAQHRRRPVSADDVRLVVSLHDPYLALYPSLTARLLAASAAPVSHDDDHAPAPAVGLPPDPMDIDGVGAGGEVQRPDVRPAAITHAVNGTNGASVTANGTSASIHPTATTNGTTSVANGATSTTTAVNGTLTTLRYLNGAVVTLRGAAAAVDPGGGVDDDDSCGWGPGGSVRDRRELAGLLDDVLGASVG